MCLEMLKPDFNTNKIYNLQVTALRTLSIPKTVITNGSRETHACYMRILIVENKLRLKPTVIQGGVGASLARNSSTEDLW